MLWFYNNHVQTLTLPIARYVDLYCINIDLQLEFSLTFIQNLEILYKDITEVCLLIDVFF